MVNIVMVAGMEFSSGSYKMEIITLENIDGVPNTAMAHNIGLIEKRHTLASMKMTKGTGMEYQHGHQEKLITASSKVTYTMDMESSSTRMATSMTESGCKDSDQAREYSQMLILKRFRKANGDMID